ncbi:DUF3678 domain-containing protein [Photobacterium damselae subsp. damselae]|nr:DUF3678 domain-containing protein [Photobacterium damselae subsp. damselae]
MKIPYHRPWTSSCNMRHRRCHTLCRLL